MIVHRGRYNATFPYKETCLFPATASCEAAGGGGSCEPCNWQIFWGVQTYSDMHRFKPVIEAVDALGVRDNTYIIFSNTCCFCCFLSLGGRARCCSLCSA
jgi:predicted glycosyltransferase